MADWYGVPLRRLLRSAERFRDKAIRCGSLDLKTDFSRSRALLCLVTRADQRPDSAVPLRPAAFLGLPFRAAAFRRWVAMSRSTVLRLDRPSAMPLEVLHFALVLLRGGARREGAEIPAPPGLGVHLAGIETILARFKLADHACTSRQFG